MPASESNGCRPEAWGTRSNRRRPTGVPIRSADALLGLLVDRGGGSVGAAVGGTSSPSSLRSPPWSLPLVRRRAAPPHGTSRQSTGPARRLTSPPPSLPHRCSARRGLAVPRGAGAARARGPGPRRRRVLLELRAGPEPAGD